MIMSEVYYFQRYHSKENAHSSNALLLLKRLYYYSPKLFYRVISKWIDVEEDTFLPNFLTQTKAVKSVPDFCIKQNGFKIIVEAKEKYNQFTESQMRNHIESLIIDNIKTRIMIALAPKFSENDNKIFDLVKKDEIKLIKLTYMDLYNDIKEVCDVYHDSEMLDILEEYEDYCNEEGLIDYSDSTIMVRLAISTMDCNISPDISLYYDNAEHKYEGFRYIGLYSNKKVQYIGEIRKVIKAYKNTEDIPVFEGLLPHKCDVTDEDKKRICKAMENQKKLYDNTHTPHCYFLVEKFVPIDNFYKNSPMALYGKKKFYLQQLGLPPKCPVEKIAEAMKNKTWEEVEGK